MFIFNKNPFSLFAVVSLIVSSHITFAEAVPPKHETPHFVFYFEDSQSDAYKDREQIAELTERIYEKIASRLKMRFDEKIPVYSVNPLFEEHLHGYGRAAMTDSGKVAIYHIYFPMNTWKKDKSFSFIKPFLPDIEKCVERAVEEEIVIALFVQKYLRPQQEPRKFNKPIYGMSAALCDRDIHSPARWILDHRSNRDYPMSTLLKSGNKWDAHMWDIVSPKFVSFGGYIIEKYGLKRFEKLLETANSENVNALVKKYYGKTTDDIEDEWGRWLREKVSVYDTPDFDLRRERYNEVSSLYLAGGRLQSEFLRRHFLDAAAALQALLTIYEYSEDVHAAAKKLSEKRFAAVAAKERFCRVDFYFTWKDAKTVSLSGDFNKWNHTAPFNHLKLVDREKGLWHTTVNLATGKYQYKFVVDDSRWITDENADGLVPDGFGGQNSVLIIDEKAKKRVVGSM